jgi:hypothetical protein
MDGFQRRSFGFQDRDAPFGFVPTRRALFVLSRCLAIGKRVVVQPATFFKHLLKQPLLAFRRRKAELIRFRHKRSIALLPNTVHLKPLKQEKGLYPSGYPLAGEAPGLYALFS